MEAGERERKRRGIGGQQEGNGRGPAPAEIEFSCSCPDWASMCKHVAVVLYGIGARLDEQPELLFKLRKVEEKELIAKAGGGLALSKTGPAAGKVLAHDGLSELFGLDISTPEEAPDTAHANMGVRPRCADPVRDLRERKYV